MHKNFATYEEKKLRTCIVKSYTICNNTFMKIMMPLKTQLCNLVDVQNKHKGN